jgi:hypothetical protein
MGSFYANITLRGPEQAEIVQALAHQKRTAFVSPTVDGFTVVGDQDCDSQDDHIIGSLVSYLSETLSCAALAILNHDDDLLWYQLYEKGRLVDKYDSCPGCLDPRKPRRPVGGNARKLCPLMAKLEREDLERVVTTILQRDDYIFALERHEDLVATLGLPDISVGLAYDRLFEEAEEQGIDLAEFVILNEGQPLGPDELESLTPCEDNLAAASSLAAPGMVGDTPRSWSDLSAQREQLTAENAIEIARQYLQAQGNPIAVGATPEAWLLPKAKNPVWMVIFLPSSPDMPGTVVYVQAVTGQVVKSQPFLRRA